MSVEALAIGLQHSRAAGPAKLILIGIANHDGDGGAWPSIATLARYAGISPTGGGVQKHIRYLEALGEIRRELQGGGPRIMAKQDRPNLYHFLLVCPVNCDRTKVHRLMCVICGLELKGMDREPRHAAEVATQMDYLTSPLTHAQCPKPRGVQTDTPKGRQVVPVVQTDTPGVSKRTTEPSLELTTNHDIENDAVLNREDVAETAESQTNKAGSADSSTTADATGSASCPRWPSLDGPHAYNRAGRCIDCGATTQSTTDETGVAL